MDETIKGDGLLADVRVVDLTDAYGAFAARVLADLGAEVIRIEPADGGAGRTRLPLAPDGTSLHHLHRNVGKDVLRTDDAKVRDGLLAGADLVLVSTDPAVDAELLHERHPHLVIASVTPYGRTGPTAGWRATELVSQALAGVVYRAGVPELPPVSAPGSYSEDFGAVVAALGGMLGVWQVRSGRPGQVVDVSAILALAHATDMGLPLSSRIRMPSQRAGAGLYPLLPCTDGLARIVLPMSPGEWRSLVAWLGSPPEWTGPEWDEPMLGPAARDQILARLPERFAAGTRDELAAQGDALGVRITPVLTPAEVLANPHTEARRTFAEVPVGDRTARVPVGVFGVNGSRSDTVRAMHERDASPMWPARPVPGSGGGPGLPLRGIRVLEVGSGVATPEAGRVLGEWGADVIKLESVRRPDFQRHVMGGDMNPAFSTPNRNKRVLAADLGTEAGRVLVHRLLPQIDLLLENNATGVIARLGLGWEQVHELNPRLVMVDTQLYGDRGPWATKKGYGPSARAIGGLTWLWAHGPDDPRGVMTIHPDHLAGRLCALGALSGLFARERTGEGVRVDVAQFEAVSLLIGDLLAAESLTPGAAQPAGNRSPQAAPWNLFRCADDPAPDSLARERWLALCVPDDVTWKALLTVAPELDRPGWAETADRLADVDAVEAAVGAWLEDADPAELEQRLQAAGVPAAQVLPPSAHATHPHFVGRGYPVTIDQPGLGPTILEGPAFTAPGMGEPRCDPAPLPREGTDDVLRELLGLSDAELAGLVTSGAIDPPVVRS